MEWLIVQLDLEYVKSSVLPELMRRYLGHGGVSATAENRGSGRYEGAVNFSMSGDWNVGVNVRLPGNNTVYAETIKLGVK